MHFASDNTAPVHPRVMEAVMAANDGPAMPYGEDPLTAEAEALLAETFGAAAVFLVTTGTAANALALSALVPPFGAVICHREAHIQTDECGAPELFTGGAKLLLVEGPEGCVPPEAVHGVMAGFVHGVHQVKPAAVSITNATEMGGIYAPAEVAAVAEAAHAHGLRLHMDGARLANALVATGVPPRAMTAEAGVDALSFGLTKNGAMMAEAVLFFDAALAEEFGRRRKRAGQLLSKARYLAAQFLALLEDGLWLELAAHANAMAARLAAGLMAHGGIALAHEVRGNEIFVWLPKETHERLQAAGAHYYVWRDEGDRLLVRFVTSWATRPQDVEALLKAL